MEQKNNNYSEHSLIISWFSRFIEWGNNNLTFSRWFFKTSKKIFMKLEIMMLVMILICLGILFSIRHFPHWLGIFVCILLIQRVLEFFIVYSRNFIFNRGRIFSQFDNIQRRGEWLITMFALNVLQIILIFATWYKMISLAIPGAFSHSLSALDSIYFSFITFVTVGYGDIYPINSLAKIVVIGQVALTFYILVIVVNGLISMHFNHHSENN